MIDSGKNRFCSLTVGHHPWVIRVASSKNWMTFLAKKYCTLQILFILPFQSLMATLQLTSTSKQTPLSLRCFSLKSGLNWIRTHPLHILCCKKVGSCSFLNFIWPRLLFYDSKFLNTMKLGNNQLGYSKVQSRSVIKNRV